MSSESENSEGSYYSEKIVIPKLTMPNGFEIDDYFLFKRNIVYQVKDLPEALIFPEHWAINKKVREKHWQYCDEDIWKSWKNRTHLSLDWANGEAVGEIADELFKIMEFFGYVEKVGSGMYHLNQLVLCVDYNENDLSGKRIPWFYKGFTIKHSTPH